MLIVRQIHAYLGMLIAPSVLFFALTGSLQLFNLHEAHGAYHPPAVFEALGSLHKDQLISSHHGDEEPAAAHASAPSSGRAAGGGEKHAHNDDAPRLSTLLLKWFFLATALGLAISTGLGLWLGLKYTRHKSLSWTLLIAGAAIPLALILA